MNPIQIQDLIQDKNVVKTPIFESTAEKINICASGKVMGAVTLTVVAVDAQNTEKPSEPISVFSEDGGFVLEHCFDPLYMLVYHDARRLRVMLSGEGLELHDFRLCEEMVVYSEEYVSPSNLVEQDGERSVLIKTLEGGELTVPVIPKKVLFFGNSILFGMGNYGMCATDPQNDYYYHVTRAI